MEVDVIVEIPQGSRNQYEMDHDTGRIRLDRMLSTSTRYPHDYGFIPDTLAERATPNPSWHSRWYMGDGAHPGIAGRNGLLTVPGQ